jgi:23S rRNA (cytidine1920-2'-O)/16S rRNA (cytidine1409-2'-O)-methyltransferase
MGSRPRFRPVVQHVRSIRPDILDPASAIAERRLLVGGVVVTNAKSLVRTDAPVELRPGRRLRGEAKLEAALAAFSVAVVGRVCLDLGAAAGGFTRVLLRHDADRVYALDAGFGQLLSELRSDPRVVNLERTNLAQAAAVLPKKPLVGLVTVDLSYLSLAAALPQLHGVPFARDADLIAVVKPQFELARASRPTDDLDLDRAIGLAKRGAVAAGWTVVKTMRSPVRGTRGSTEWLLHGQCNSGGGDPAS